MFQFAQLDTGLPGKFWVQPQNFHGEGYLVGDALARPVAAAEQFEVFKRVVLAVAITMMHCFFGEKLAAKMFGHHVTMFEYGVLFASNKRWDRNPNVTMPFDVTADFAAIKLFQRLGALVFGFAILIAVFLLCMETPAWFAALCIFFAASFAFECVRRFAGSTSPCSRAWNRTVQRRSSKFLFVSFNVRMLHRESFAAFSAGKSYQLFARRRQTLAESMGASASERAVFLVRAGVAVERLLTVFTNFLNRYVAISLFRSEVSLQAPVGKVK